MIYIAHKNNNSTQKLISFFRWMSKAVFFQAQTWLRDVEPKAIFTEVRCLDIQILKGLPE